MAPNKASRNDVPQNDINEKSWFLLGEMILEKESEEIMEKYRSSETSINGSNTYSSYDKKNIAQIRKTLNRSKHRQNTFGNILAAVGVVFLITITVCGSALAFNPEIRLRLLNAIIETTPEYTSIQIGNENDTGDITAVVPDDWGGKCFPSIMPAGLILSDMQNVNGAYHGATYTYPNGGSIIFEYSEFQSGTLNTDTENAEIQDVIVSGYEGSMIVKDGTVKILWSDGTTLYEIYARESGSKKALIYANSVHVLQ